MEWSSDDDEEIIDFLTRGPAVRQILPRSNLFETSSEDKFVRRFRLKKATTLFLLDQIKHHLEFKVDRKTSITPLNQLLCTLRFYATGSQIITCGDLIGVHESTACRIIHRVTHAIALLYKRYIKLPTTNESQQEVVAKFYKIAKFPRVVGAIDCTHVRIISPGGDDAEIYRNRKGYMSINVQCVAAANLKFLDVVARWHGSAHDSNIWDNCALKRLFLRGSFNDKVLLGDSGYAQKDYMMTPLPEGRVNTRAEALYQESQVKSRNVVERAFGVWKRRFPILSRGISVHLRKVPGIIIATAVLHNLALEQNEEVPQEEPNYPHLLECRNLATSSTAVQPQVSGRNLLIDEYFSSL